MKRILTVSLFAICVSSYASPRKCVSPEIEINLNSNHEIAKAITNHETKQSHKRVKIKNLRLTQICEQDDKGIQEFEVEYSYIDIDELGCTADVEVKNEKVIKVRSLCEV